MRCLALFRSRRVNLAMLATALPCLWLASSPRLRAALSDEFPNTTFFTPRATVWLGRSQMVPFRLATPAGADLNLIATPAAPAMVEVLRQPAVLAGETTGFLRLRGLQSGATRLNLQGGGAIDLDVRPDPAGAAFALVDAESRQPRIVSPMAGAVVWERFTVGVEVFDNTPRAQAHDLFHVTGPAGPAPAAVKVQLRLPSGQMLDPVDQGPGTEFGPVRHLAFEVNAADLRPGPFRLTAVSLVQNPADPGHRNGANALPLESEPLALIAHPPQPTGYWAGEAESVVTDAREVLAPSRPAKFGVHQPKVDKDPNASGGAMVSNGGGDTAWCLPFIVREPGDYQMMIRARGDFAIGAYPTVALHLNSTEREVGIVRLASGKYHRVPVGTPVHLDAGPQVLTLQFKNGFGQGKESRKFYFDRYEIQRVGGTATDYGAKATALNPTAPLPRDASPLAASAAAQALALINAPSVASLLPAVDAPPRLGILYPANGAAAYHADAVVAFAANGARLVWADLLIDDQPQNLRRLNPLPGEAMLFPLLARGVGPGSHRIAVRGNDDAGRQVDSPAQMLTILPEAPGKAGPYDRAVRLLNRFGFGPEPRELAAVLTLGESAWLNNRLAAGFDSPMERALLRVASARFPQTEDSNQTIARALTQWIGSENPVRSRFSWWAENHFTTWMEKIGAFPQWCQHLAFCRLGVAPFADLLNASAQSPAMLTYLDQEKSYASKLNENYAREIMELHTLGVHGGYRQADVTSLASVLNGWTLAEEALVLNRDDTVPLKISDRGDRTGLSKGLRFVPSLNDGKEQQVFGLDLPAADPAARYDRVRLAIEMLATHPRTADHICRKLAEHYVSVPAPDDLVKNMAGVFMESGGDLRPVLRTMVGHPAFWRSEPKVATPLDFGLREARLCRAAILEVGGDPEQGMKPDQVASFLKRSGMGLFDHISPEGYPQNNGAYSDSNALLQRWRFVQAQADALNRLVPPQWRNVPSPGDDQRFVDLAAIRLTGQVLSEDSNRSALDLLNSDPTPAMAREVLVFISMMPENNLR